MICASFLCASLVHFSIYLCQKSLSLCLVNILPKCLNLQEIWLCRSVSGLTDNDWRWGGVCHTYILQYYTQQYYTEYQSCDQRVSMHSMIQRRKRELREAIYLRIGCSMNQEEELFFYSGSREEMCFNKLFNDYLCFDRTRKGENNLNFMQVNESIFVGLLPLYLVFLCVSNRSPSYKWENQFECR